MGSRKEVRRAQSQAHDAREEARKFHAAVTQPDMALVIFFCSSAYDLDVVAAETHHLFAGVPVAGCTTAGKIGPTGYCDHTIAGASFPADQFSATVGLIEHLQEFGIERGQTFAQDALLKLEGIAPLATLGSSFGLLLIDGLSVREELVARIFQSALGKLQLIGGSAGDGLLFQDTYVYHEGRFHPDSALLTLVTPPLPFKPIIAQHFVVSDQRVVVTEADTRHRLVREIDGRPSAQAYAQLIGTRTDALDPMRFAASPMVVTIGGTHCVRSISKARADGSLTLFCAIDEDMVLRVAHGADLVGNLERTVASVCAGIGEPQLVIGCNCILRRLETAQKHLVDQVDGVMRRNKVIGFNNYGEQYRGMHVNQTLTGIAIGSHESPIENA